MTYIIKVLMTSSNPDGVIFPILLVKHRGVTYRRMWNDVKSFQNVYVDIMRYKKFRVLGENRRNGPARGPFPILYVSGIIMACDISFRLILFCPKQRKPQTKK